SYPISNQNKSDIFLRKYRFGISFNHYVLLFYVILCHSSESDYIFKIKRNKFRRFFSDFVNFNRIINSGYIRIPELLSDIIAYFFGNPYKTSFFVNIFCQKSVFRKISSELVIMYNSYVSGFVENKF